MTAHQEHFFHERQDLDPFVIVVRFLDNQPACRLEHAHQIFDCLPLITEMMQCIHHQNTIEESIRKREVLGMGEYAADFLSLCLFQHPQGQIGDDDIVH